jgi:hypothetical protein
MIGLRRIIYEVCFGFQLMEIAFALGFLPVHWYHLFVSIRYHKKMHFAIWNIVQTDENILV